ncbi:heptaprenylglyceryl phosphate synthase [Domibacillus sp. DTU_2020_1001157_1_SI_ALB_TIR_016]|uniref:heptaprenylglyceryl phosphate synthase n=1 Tax=Domibacillus sp. DTU_2020_1001157_1_SI_ALB_TIR_016 TaxID=3077789 RepID=UPI0028EA1A8C|nr:heptaprenylglyceryl phosphate synthase [Domibacillus sp. DTU_2020_1001157_1_SI_ALB_TIR_016]WNS80322.1 heptaprenylglyceryl phosphate synthase [Domibacillus sp. DTU_2020_1001157_1_SI_ALB_TIR_016]
MYDVREWRHVFKLDPNKPIDDELLERVCESGTDAIVVGGSDGVTLDNVLDLMVRVRRFPLPCVLEVSSLEIVTPGFDLYLIPTVLNTSQAEWITGLHVEAMKEYGDLMDPGELIVEGYCIANPDCKAAKLTGVSEKPDTEDIIAYARLAGHLWKLPVFYLEYSGTYGDVEAVQQAAEVLKETETVFFYGGGIQTARQAKEIGQYADVVVVGNAVYEKPEEALKTVTAVQK